MKKLIFIFTVFFSYTALAQNTEETEKKLKEVTGIITLEDSPLSGVNILIKNSKRGTNTNKKGFYKIIASAGEIIQFSHLNMKPIKILVEDITTILNLEMRPIENFLDEIIITSSSDSKNGFGLKTPRKFSSARMNIDTRKAGFAATLIKGEDLNPAASSIAQALRGKISNYKLVTDLYGNEYVRLRETSFTGTVVYALWDVDGILYTEVPIVDLNNIKEIAVIKGLAGTVKYGSEAAGGVIIVTTKSNSFTSAANKGINSKDNKYTNQDYYNNDAIAINDLKTGESNYSKLLKTALTPSGAYDKYKSIYPEYKTNTNFHFNAANYFIHTLSSKEYGLKVLLDLETYANNNPEVLKALAYKYQELRMHQKAILIYKKLIVIRPKHAQSFRDLANAFTHANEYKNAWKIYLYYLKKGFKIEENGIGEIFNTEMKAIYVQRKEKDNIKEKLNLINNDTLIENDIRMVFEWNTSEAEFIFEFVNPNKQSFKVNHSLSENSEQILDEKLVGYNSKEFFIEKVGKGDWLINLTYLGNKKYTPTFLKATTYYNWGKPNQREEIKVHELTLKNVKAKLLSLNTNNLSN
jgi:tetratricopeptide (TPR) repeat protein